MANLIFNRTSGHLTNTPIVFPVGHYTLEQAKTAAKAIWGEMIHFISWEKQGQKTTWF